MFPLSLLPLDIIFVIIYNLNNVHDVINLSAINQEIYCNFDDSIYLYWGRNLYTKEFWDSASMRSPIISKPLTSMKTELLRIEIFQNHLIKHGMEMWTKEDFYKYWECLERYRGTPYRGTPPNPRAVGCTHRINDVGVSPVNSLAVGM